MTKDYDCPECGFEHVKQVQSVIGDVYVSCARCQDDGENYVHKVYDYGEDHKEP